ncbi:MAG: choice-of-anchor tandem repeat GloVer-containing protein [Verrucomicrobiia bacterium]
MLIQGSDGNIYGTTQLGGKNNYGTIFKLMAPLHPPPYPINQITGVHVAATNIIFDVVTIAGSTYQLQFTTNLTSGTWLYVSGAAVTNSIGALLTLTNFGGAAGRQGFYRFAITP